MHIKTKLFFLLDKIKKQGYSNSISEFINKYPETGYRFDKKQGSIFLRSINGSNRKCLVINSDLGNIPEFLSTIFEKVISIDIEEKILIQTERFKHKKINNIQFEISESNNMLNLEKDSFSTLNNSNGGLNSFHIFCGLSSKVIVSLLISTKYSLFSIKRYLIISSFWSKSIIFVILYHVNY